VRDDVMEGAWRAPVSDGSGRDRAIAKSALDELAAAGYSLRDGRLVDAHGAPLAFEILVRNRAEERLALAYARNLARIGVAANVRLVDEVQFQRRRTSFDFEMMIGTWIASPSPGNEQRGRWSSAAADAQGAYNISGVKSPAVDAMIAAILAAETDEDFVAAVTRLSSGSLIRQSSAVPKRHRCSASSFRAGGGRRPRPRPGWTPLTMQPGRECRRSQCK
jgi:peptide/nickel transport system substrate-binding protein